MPDRKDYDVVVKVCDFTTKSKTAGKVIDKESFVKNVLEDSKFKLDLAAGKILGLFTHKGRYDPQSPKIPYADNIANSPYLSNVTKALWVEGDDLLAGIDILKDTEAGKKLTSFFKSKVKVPVSMSVKARGTIDKYLVESLYGIDFTFEPDLESEVLAVNFSNNSESKDTGIYEFSYLADVKVNNPDEEGDADFSTPDELDEKYYIVRGSNDKEFWDGTQWSSTDYPKSFDTELEASTYVSDNNLDDAKVVYFSDLNFSLRTYLTEMELAPYQILRRRIFEVITMVSQRKQDWIDKHADVLKGYISNYIMQWIQGILNNPDSQFNLTVGLQLNRYVKDRSRLMELQRSMTRVRQQLNQNGIITNQVQKTVNTSYQKVLTSIYEFINDKTYTSGKRLK